MITSFIRRLLGKRASTTSTPTTASDAKIISVRQHKINPELISRNAIKVTHTLQQAGYQAYIVGGAVRDLLLNISPKDFDIATNATPEQVQALFRRARLIGRRFQIVHVVFQAGRSQEIIEVSTFRALIDAQRSTHVGHKPTSSAARHRRRELDSHTHATDPLGRVLRDNVWGHQSEDAWRRDFTINAMYYDPATQTVHDYHDGLTDLRKGVLRMIGDPETRYREDPVRMLRAIRFAAKTGVTIAPATAAPITQLAHLIHHVPAARVFDEMLKLLCSGHAWASLQQLRQAGLQHGILPLLDVMVEQPDGAHFIKLALANTDERIAQGKSVSPGFLFAALLWHQVQKHWEARQATGELALPALHAAMDEVLHRQTQQLAIQRRHVGDMKEIWLLQPRFERRVGRSPLRLLEAARMRAGYDFLLLRCAAGELPTELGEWWTQFQFASMPQREEMLVALHAQSASGLIKKKRRRRPRKPLSENGMEQADLPSLPVENDE